MANWKELGEVPDSEDEDLDASDSQDLDGEEPLPSLHRSENQITRDLPASQNQKALQDKRAVQSQPQSPSTKEKLKKTATTTPITTTETPTIVEGTAKGDIWEFPGSSDDSNEDHHGKDPSPKPRPASTLPTTPSRRRSPLGSTAPTSNGQLSSPLTPPPATISDEASQDLDSQPTPIAFPRDETPISFRNDANGHSSKSPTGFRPPQSEPSAALGSQVRHERSLRPRKPIQEHPYLLENVQYSTFLRKHGVKPLRMALDLAPEHTDDQSQDALFEQQSQEVVLPPDTTDESQQTGSADIRDASQPMLLSSSPLQSSALGNQGETSSLPSSQETRGTNDADLDLPDLDQLLKSRPKARLPKFKPSKRKTPQPSSSARKRQRRIVAPIDVEGLPDPLTSFPGAASHHLSSAPRVSDELFEESLAELLEPPPRFRIPSVVLPSEEEADSLEKEMPADPETLSSQSESEDEELVTRIGKRIRGVLPASWLRLDQQSSRDKARHDVLKIQPRGFDRGSRRGVAQPKANLPGVTSTSTRSIFDEIEEEEEEGGGGNVEEEQRSTMERRTTDDVFHRQALLGFEPIAETTPYAISSDDSISVVEEDSIDRMVSRRKRQLKLSDAFDRTSKRNKKDSSAPQNGRLRPERPKPKQRRITNLASNVKPRRRTCVPDTGEGRRHGQAALAFPRLSILDVIQRDAPRFVRIAARTARRRENQGRSAFRGKSIKLATRQDNIDAASVLEEWRTGLIKPRPSVTAACQSRQRRPQQPQPLSDTSANIVVELISQSKAAIKPRVLKRQVSQGGSVTFRQTGRPETSSLIKRRTIMSKDTRRGIPGPERPAQLEIPEREQQKILKFSALKRLLDRSYRKRAKDNSITDSVQSLEKTLDLRSESGPEIAPAEEAHHNRREKQHRPKTSRLRKATRPSRIDVEAPQYLYADDPIPAVYLPLPGPSEVQTGAKKLQGLGPYGTRYTHHFEIFPLGSGVFFHESTLLGSGIIETCLNNALASKHCGSRPRVHFSLGEQMLRWGPWDDNVSSELGIILDVIAEHVECDGSGDGVRSPAESGALEVATFLLRYVTEALSVEEESLMAPVVTRFHQVLTNFCDRTGSRVQQFGSDQRGKYDSSLRILDRLLVVSFFMLRMCQTDASRFQEQSKMEDTVRSLARISLLLVEKSGFGQLSKVYRDLARTSYRGRGLRDDMAVFHTCTLLMKVLELARIPRFTFWDSLEASLDLAQVLSGVDIQRYEHVWETMFFFLPLTEFNHCGIIALEKWYDTAVDGWAIPQKLLKRVFELYQGDDRQAPSFNNYCRALVGRCHYLQRQWGWHRSAPIIGVVFDFFGTRDFANLRNEESHKSPRFLEELALNPSLDLEPNDMCFHVFLKLLALSIRALRKSGHDKDIRNLVVRTIPNHNRQYLKEQNIHERDLAALRNQHDLIAALYWACPPKLRPSVTLVERLVAPETSHKEACLINIRAWSQLARFIVASGEATTFPKHLGPWRSSFFQKMLQQFESVASDIQQQLSSLSKDVSESINRDMVRAMIMMNKAAAKDVLSASLAASLDVMRQAADLEAASFCFSSTQLQQVFNNFTVMPPELDWTLLRTALATLGSFMSRIEEFKDNEESQQNESQILNSAQADDALIVIDNDLSRSFFLMTRSIMSYRGHTKLAATLNSEWPRCIKEAVELAARIGARFIDGGIMRISDMFKEGKHGVFSGPPRSLNLVQRKYLPLFLTSLMKQGFDGFVDANFSLAEAWALSLVKPREYLEYENQLAEQLHRQGKDFVPEAVAGLVSVHPDYGSNRDLFAFAISTARRAIRDAAPSLKKVVVKEYSGILEAIMTQMKADLHLILPEASEHHAYVIFVRDIISLIKVHGSEICAVQDFFYKISKEYSPSKQDPQLQVAGMMSYGLRLQEGDIGVARPLFYLLFNNFKFAMSSNRLYDDVRMLVKGMRNEGIFRFVLGKMLPSVIGASFNTEFAFIILDVYAEALNWRLNATVVGYEFQENDVVEAVAVLQAIVAGTMQMRQKHVSLSAMQIHVLRQTTAIMNTLLESLIGFNISNPGSSCWESVKAPVSAIEAYASRASVYLASGVQDEGQPVRADLLFRGLPPAPTDPAPADPYVNDFTADIVEDIARNWVVGGPRVFVQAPSQPRATPSRERGVEVPVWSIGEMLTGLGSETRETVFLCSRISGALFTFRYERFEGPGFY